MDTVHAARTWLLVWLKKISIWSLIIYIFWTPCMEAAFFLWDAGPHLRSRGAEKTSEAAVPFVLLRSYVIFIPLQCDIVLVSKWSFGCKFFFCELLVSRSKSCSVGYIIFTQNVSLVTKGYYSIRWPYNIFVYSALHWTKVPRR